MDWAALRTDSGMSQSGRSFLRPAVRCITVEIRPADFEDVSPVSELVKRAYGPYVESIGRRPEPMDDDYAEKVRTGRLFVAEKHQIVGLIVLIPQPGHLLIENVAVDPDHQGKGVGRRLLAHAEIFALQCGTPELRLYTNAAMVENIALYSRLGYNEIDRRRESGFDRVFLLKNLDSEMGFSD
jgi:ribosomal protein S18 acetylase RimI-like enzyme